MKTYFDEATDKRLLEAQGEEEVKAIIAETPEAEKLADKTELIMAELARIKGSLDNELELDELDNTAGGAKTKTVNLSESRSCMATFFLEDEKNRRYCWSNDQCGASNEYDYHYTRWSNCKSGGKHEWADSVETDKSASRVHEGLIETAAYHTCKKCGLKIKNYECNYNS